MKRFVGLLILGLLISSTVCFAAGNELRIKPYYIVPGEDDQWDNAVGLEAQLVIWNTPNLGFAIAGGLARWDVNDSIQAEEDGAYKFSGSATTFPLGVSVLFRPTSGGTAEITLEGGLRYVFVSSDVDVVVTDYYDTYAGSVDIDDGLVGLLGADVAFPFSQTVKLGFGAGYQFDISKGKGTFYGFDIGDSEMKGFFLRLGLDVKM